MEEIKEITQAEGLKLQLADTLKETTRLAGTLRVNGTMQEVEELKGILINGASSIEEFNKLLSAYLNGLY